MLMSITMLVTIHRGHTGYNNIAKRLLLYKEEYKGVYELNKNTMKFIYRVEYIGFFHHS